MLAVFLAAVILFTLREPLTAGLSALWAIPVTEYLPSVQINPPKQSLFSGTIGSAGSGRATAPAGSADTAGAAAPGQLTPNFHAEGDEPAQIAGEQAAEEVKSQQEGTAQETEL